ncbi:hypothetical protein HYX09_05695 [Candidatus Woesearchaeota archaeon]|nr:hypothetical protein [Candidatus Woesearchaeota archaeon]
MSKEVFDKIREESAYLGIIALVSIIIFKIIFYNESTINVLRIVFSLLWLFGLPGYFLMLHWQESLDFRERFVVGIALAAAVVGISSYYLGLIEINIKYHGFMLPPIIIAIGLVSSIMKKTKV